jgi:predicted O-linked N-acetylglucosamine transferase (SPINDLY family)
VHYLGFPGTLGADCIDYLIADPTLVSDGDRRHYAEKIVRLPHSYQANDATRQASERLPTRSDCGLAAGAFVFCCFNNSFKIGPAVFDAWAAILRRVGGSVLWLLEDNAAGAANLRKEAQRRGIDADRLVFAQRIPPAEHLARHRLADLFLDTLPYNAHTTASDALWAGLPVLTQIGDTFSGRVAASLLHAIGLPELVTRSPAEYGALAVELANDATRLTGLRTKLASNRLAMPLFDTRLFTRHLESAYQAMYDRHTSGLPPDHIDVKALD